MVIDFKKMLIGMSRQISFYHLIALIYLLSKSFYAKLLAVLRVTINKGGKTPGVVNIVWKYPAEKLKAALNLKTRGYQSKPFHLA